MANGVLSALPIEEENMGAKFNSEVDPKIILQIQQAM